MPFDQVVLDRTLFRALLSMAAKEKLIYEKNTDNDGYFQGLINSKTPEWLENQVLEQVALFPSIVSVDKIPYHIIDGPLFEKIDLKEDNTPNPNYEASAVSVDIIEGMLQARGHQIEVSQFLPRISQLQAALTEQDAALRQNPEFGTDYTAASIRSFVDPEYRISSVFRQLEHWHSMREPAMPLIAVARDLITVNSFGCFLLQASQNRTCVMKCEKRSRLSYKMERKRLRRNRRSDPRGGAWQFLGGDQIV
jgi:hypothetical protein